MHHLTTSRPGVSPPVRHRLAHAAWLALAAVGTAGLALPAAASNLDTPVPGRILVMPRAGLSDAALTAILAQHGGGQGRRVGASALRIVDLPAGQEAAAVDRLSRHPHIKFAEQDRRIAPSFASDDPYFGSQWHLPVIGANIAWDAARGDGVTIAILDTGVDSAHPDLAARMVGGWNVYSSNNDTADVYGHGTKVAGTAAAIMGNGTGVAGVAGNARIMPVRISAADGSATYSAMAQGITWAADHGARVANISYVAAASASVLSAAGYMKNKGGLVVTAAGNAGTDAGIAPTTALIAVSATDASDTRTSWSSFGSFVALSAPGAGIYTTTSGGGYAAVSGTSFASPVTAGVVALVMSANGSLSAAQVESVLYSTAVDLGASGRDPYYGYGRVNAAGAVQAALGMVTKADTVAPVAAINAPLGSSTVSGLVAVNVSATDNVGVTKVELRSNGQLVATEMAAPYAFSWDSSSVANGMNNLVATAYDAAGNAGASMVVSVNVANVNSGTDTTPPTVRLTQPANGAQVTGNVSIAVDASDDAGAAGIRQTLYIDGKVVASVSGGSLSYRWNTRKAAAGTHVIQAVASDAAGNTSSQTVQVSN
ncbi:MAG: S8 family serine peptidase [Burkholderiaceae bacterium]